MWVVERMGNCSSPAQVQTKTRLGNAEQFDSFIAGTEIESATPSEQRKRRNTVRKLHALKSPDGTVNRPWKPDAGGKVRFKGITEESFDLTDKEIDLVIKPVFDRLGHDRVRDCLSEDTLLRVVRGLNNNHPETDKWKPYAVEVGDHASAVAEGLDIIMEWRHRADVQANTLLSRRLPNNDTFHEMWPMSVTGYDVHGHIVECERLANIDSLNLAKTFGMDETLLHITQRQDAIQILQTKESMRRLAQGSDRTYKHIHIIDLEGLSLYSFYKIKGTLIPVFKHLGDQFPNTAWKIFAVNSPSTFSTIWGIIKNFIDPETVAKVNIMSISETKHGAGRFIEAGIPLDQLPNWLPYGTSTIDNSLQNIVNECIKEGEASKGSRPVDSVFYPKLPLAIFERVNGASAAAAAANAANAAATAITSSSSSSSGGVRPGRLAAVVASREGEENRDSDNDGVAHPHVAPRFPPSSHVVKPPKAATSASASAADKTSSGTHRRLKACAWFGWVVAMLLVGVMLLAASDFEVDHRLTTALPSCSCECAVPNQLPLSYLAKLSPLKRLKSVDAPNSVPTTTTTKSQSLPRFQLKRKAKKAEIPEAAAIAIDNDDSAENGTTNVTVFGFEVDLAALANADAAFVEDKHDAMSEAKAEVFELPPSPQLESQL